MSANIVQLNAGKRPDAWQQLALNLHDHNIKVALIQEPPVKGNIIPKLSPNTEIFCGCPSGDFPLSCILLGKDLVAIANPIILTSFSDDLQTAVRLKIVLQNGNSLNAVLCSIYFPDGNLPLNLENCRKLVEYCSEESLELIIGSYANSHHPFWSDKNIDNRGIEMVDFIQDNNLELLNRGTVSTYYIERTDAIMESCIDLSIATKTISRHISNWRVSLQDSCSDHRYIFFGFSMEKIKPTYYVRKKATNYQKYRKILSAKLRTYVLRVNTIEELDESAETLTNSIMDSFNQCKVERKCKEIVRLPYLTQVHMNKSADLKKQFKRAYKPRNSNKNLRLKYRKDLNEHMKSIRRARNNS